MFKGIALSIFIAIIAVIISRFTILGSVVIAIILGILITNSIKIPDSFNSGITYSEKSLLAFAIATLGINLDFRVLSELGIYILFIIVSGMMVTIFSTLLFAKFLNIDKRFALILGIGNGVCGASAIGSTKDIIKVEASQAGIAVAVVNLLGTIGMFLVPSLAIYLGFNDTEAGILSGNTLQAVGQAVAGGFSISSQSGESATIVKMVRVLLLTPIIIILLMIYTKNSNTKNQSFKKAILNIPSFIIWFIIFSIIATLGILPIIIVDSIATLSKYILIVAMAAIGLKITFKNIRAEGKKAIILGSMIFCIQIFFSVVLILN